MDTNNRATFGQTVLNKYSLRDIRVVINSKAPTKLKVRIKMHLKMILSYWCYWSIGQHISAGIPMSVKKVEIDLDGNLLVCPMLPAINVLILTISSEKLASTAAGTCMQLANRVKENCP